MKEKEGGAGEREGEGRKDIQHLKQGVGKSSKTGKSNERNTTTRIIIN